MLVIAYAIAGHVSIDFEREPLGVGKDGREVYLKDVWPTREEIQAVEREFVVPAMFKEVYSTITVRRLGGDGGIRLLDIGGMHLTVH